MASEWMGCLHACIHESFYVISFSFSSGIGKIPDAVLSQLTHHKDLGIHSEMISDGVMQLTQTGAITNAKKVIHPGHTVTSFVMGSQKFYNFLNNNPSVMFLESGYVNNPVNIARNPKVVSINSCIEVCFFFKVWLISFYF
jgi:4-hydroxybutyrate CoA-transferase